MSMTVIGLSLEKKEFKNVSIPYFEKATRNFPKHWTITVLGTVEAIATVMDGFLQENWKLFCQYSEKN